MLHRLMGYLWSTRDYKLVGRIRDPLEDLTLVLFVDADFCGDREDTKSTTGAYLVLTGPNGTCFPLSWIVKKQSATSRSTTEVEMIALAYALFNEALPTVGLWDLLLGRNVDIYYGRQRGNHTNRQRRFFAQTPSRPSPS